MRAEDPRRQTGQKSPLNTMSEVFNYLGRCQRGAALSIIVHSLVAMDVNAPISTERAWLVQGLRHVPARAPEAGVLVYFWWGRNQSVLGPMRACSGDSGGPLPPLWIT